MEDEKQSDKKEKREKIKTKRAMAIVLFLLAGFFVTTQYHIGASLSLARPNGTLNTDDAGKKEYQGYVNPVDSSNAGINRNISADIASASDTVLPLENTKTEKTSTTTPEMDAGFGGGIPPDTLSDQSNASGQSISQAFTILSPDPPVSDCPDAI